MREAASRRKRECSDLTTGIQIADLVAYIILWGFRTKDMVAPARKELDDYVKNVRQLRHRTIREIKDNPEFIIWRIGVIKGLGVKDFLNAAPKHYKASDCGYRHILEKIKRNFMISNRRFIDSRSRIRDNHSEKWHL